MSRALLILFLTGCSVEYPGILDEGFFACSSAEDCGPGWGCAEGNVYNVDFCRPACDQDDPSTCPDGVCTAAGACLERCTIDADGNPSTCQGEEFTCVRTDAVRDIGVCYPVQGCSRTADCPSDGRVPQLCLNEALNLPATSGTELRFDNLYCTGAADRDGRCPTGYLSFRVTDPSGRSRTVCYPPCAFSGTGDPGSPYCPPSMTCFRGVGDLLGLPETPPCVPGVWGLPCADDTQCLIGRCLSIGGGQRACTETCAWAEDNRGGCDGLEQLGSAFGLSTQMTCEEVGFGERICVPRYDLLSLCDQQLDCVANVGCLEVPVSTSARAHVCFRACGTDEECAEGTGGAVEDYRCIATFGGGGVCSRRRQPGPSCRGDLDCRTGRCCELGEGLRACLSTCP